MGVTETIVQTTKSSQLPGYLYLMCMISINLGFFQHMLPIPGLDGSRIIFLLIEAVRGKPFKREGYVHAFGMILLFALMIWVNLRYIEAVLMSIKKAVFGKGRPRADFPISIQSMTNTPTENAAATGEQILQLAAAGQIWCGSRYITRSV